MDGVLASHPHFTGAIICAGPSTHTLLRMLAAMTSGITCQDCKSQLPWSSVFEMLQNQPSDPVGCWRSLPNDENAGYASARLSVVHEEPSSVCPPAFWSYGRLR